MEGPWEGLGEEEAPAAPAAAQVQLCGACHQPNEGRAHSCAQCGVNLHSAAVPCRSRACIRGKILGPVSPQTLKVSRLTVGGVEGQTIVLSIFSPCLP